MGCVVCSYDVDEVLIHSAAQGFAVFFVAALPWLAALGVAIVIIRVIRKKTKKQRK